jgi:type VI secretion system secreted protein Hcp
MASDWFLKVDGIPGGSKDVKHKDWIEVVSWSMGHNRQSVVSGSTGSSGKAGPASFDDLRIAKYHDLATVKLANYCAQGTPIGCVVLECCRAGGDKMRFMEVKMENVVVSSWQTGGKPKDSDNAATDPFEHVTFTFAKVKWTYTDQKREDGTGGGQVAGGWDLTKNTSSQ